MAAGVVVVWNSWVCWSRLSTPAVQLAVELDVHVQIDGARWITHSFRKRQQQQTSDSLSAPPFAESTRLEDARNLKKVQ